MIKKLLMACTAVVAFAAVVLPAIASASPVLTESGTAVATGKSILGTQVGTSKLTNTEGTKTQLECSTGTMQGELTKNNGTEIEGKITSALFGGTGAQATGEPKPECTGESSFGNASVTAVVSSKEPWCLRSTSAMAANEFTISSGGCPGGGTIKFIMVTTIAGSCEYESTGHITGTYTPSPEEAVLTVTNSPHTSGATTNGFKLLTNNFLCPTSGSLDMSFSLETGVSPFTSLTIS